MPMVKSAAPTSRGLAAPGKWVSRPEPPNMLMDVVSEDSGPTLRLEKAIMLPMTSGDRGEKSPASDMGSIPGWEKAAAKAASSPAPPNWRSESLRNSMIGTPLLYSTNKTKQQNNKKKHQHQQNTTKKTRLMSSIESPPTIGVSW